MDYEKALRSVRSAAHELSRFVEEVYARNSRVAGDRPRDYYELLGVARDARRATIKKSFRRLARQLHPDVSDHPEAEVRFREITEAYEVLSSSERRALYDRYGHAGLRSGGFTPTHFDMGNLGDLFASFFGDDIFGGAAGAARRRGADLGAEIEIELVDAARGTTVAVPFEVAVDVHDAAAATASSRARRRAPARAATGTAGCTRFRAACSASSCARSLPRLPRPRRDRRAPVPRRATAPGATLEERDAERRRARRHPRRAAHPRLAAKVTPARSAAARATSTSLVHVSPTRASCAKATTSTRRST